MSTSTPDTTTGSQPAQVTLPTGWTAGPARETTATNQGGQVQQGVQVPINGPNGSASTVFIPYQTLQQGVAAVQAVFDARLASLQLLPGQS
jgi:hypothetical protein